MAISYDEKRFVVGGQNTGIKILATSNGSVIKSVADTDIGEVVSLKITSDDKYIISAWADRQVKVFGIEGDLVNFPRMLTLAVLCVSSLITINTDFAVLRE